MREVTLIRAIVAIVLCGLAPALANAEKLSPCPPGPSASF